MGGANVKITMIERVLQVIAPHPCYSCGKVGSNLCPYCKYNIVSEPFLGCILCATPSTHGICLIHGSPLKRVFVVSTRTGGLEAAINGLKFARNKSCARTLAELLDDSLPVLPENTLIVPVPTIAPHIRSRGYDQVDLIARHFARLRKLPYRRILSRRTRSVQHTASRQDRIAQAKATFGIKDPLSVQGLSDTHTILLIDDIITTGSTLNSAAELLNNYEIPVFGAALAYQPLD